MTYAEFQGRTSFAKRELLAFAHGRLVDDPPAGFEAAITFTPPGGQPETWTIRQDSRISH